MSPEREVDFCMYCGDPAVCYCVFCGGPMCSSSGCRTPETLDGGYACHACYTD